MLISFARTIILYLLVIVAMRIMGKRQIGQLQPSEFVIAMMLAELATIPMQDVNIPLIYGILPILTLISIEILISVAVLKSAKARRLFEGKACILVKDGEFDIEALRKLRYNIDDVMEELRSGGYTDIREVAFVILETSGIVSIIPKSSQRPPTAEELNVKVEKCCLPQTVIKDRHLHQEGLEKLNIKKEELLQLLHKNQIQKVEDVFFATLDENKNLYYQLYRQRGKVG